MAFEDIRCITVDRVPVQDPHAVASAVLSGEQSVILLTSIPGTLAQSFLAALDASPEGRWRVGPDAIAKATEAASSKPSNVAMTGKRAAPMVKEMRPSRALSGILLPSPRMFAKPLISSGPSVSREGPHCAAATKAILSSACQGSGAICPPRLSLQSRPVSANLSQSRSASPAERRGS